MSATGTFSYLQVQTVRACVCASVHMYLSHSLRTTHAHLPSLRRPKRFVRFRILTRVSFSLVFAFGSSCGPTFRLLFSSLILILDSVLFLRLRKQRASAHLVLPGLFARFTGVVCDNSKTFRINPRVLKATKRAYGSVRACSVEFTTNTYNELQDYDDRINS